VASYVCQVSKRGPAMTPGSAAPPRKSGISAATRLFRSAPKPPRILRPFMHVGNESSFIASAGSLFDVAIPSDKTSPSCMCCGMPVSWSKLSQRKQRLLLARGGFYVNCNTCRDKNDPVITKSTQWMLLT
jgi:hypothetical protein